MTNYNLNEITPIYDDNFRDIVIKDNSLITDNINVYFRNLDKILIHHIEQSDAIFGCVAWLTHPDILNALSKKQTSIIVQKEDFLRPDGDITSFKTYLRNMYNNLKCDLYRFEIDNMIHYLSQNSCNISIDPIRCVGNHNSNKTPTFPRMHNKFIVFCKIINSDKKLIKPYSVWTGSFNFTKNSNNSFENAVYIKNEDVVKRYYNEYGQIFSLSEQLDWEREWISPEFRIGT